MRLPGLVKWHSSSSLVILDLCVQLPSQTICRYILFQTPIANHSTIHIFSEATLQTFAWRSTKTLFNKMTTVILKDHQWPTPAYVETMHSLAIESVGLKAVKKMISVRVDLLLRELLDRPLVKCFAITLNSALKKKKTQTYYFWKLIKLMEYSNLYTAFQLQATIIIA